MQDKSIFSTSKIIKKVFDLQKALQIKSGETISQDKSTKIIQPESYPNFNNISLSQSMLSQDYLFYIEDEIIKQYYKNKNTEIDCEDVLFIFLEISVSKLEQNMNNYKSEV